MDGPFGAWSIATLLALGWAAPMPPPARAQHAERELAARRDPWPREGYEVALRCFEGERINVFDRATQSSGGSPSARDILADLDRRRAARSSAAEPS